MIRLLAFTCAIVANLSAWSQELVKVKGIYYQVFDAAAVVVAPPDYDQVSYSGDVVLESKVKNLPVTTISEGAFTCCENLTSVTMPETMTFVDSRSFVYCSNLKSVYLSKNVNTVCSPMAVQCPKLTSVIVDKDNKHLDSRDGCNAVIETETDKLIAGCIATAVPGTVKEIGQWAFASCDGLESIVIPNGVRKIGSYAFSDCGDLKSVSLPGSLLLLDSYAFTNCASLSSIVIPKSVMVIGTTPFNYCESLASIIVEEGNQAYDSRNGCNAIIETATNRLIQGCNTTVIPGTVEEIAQFSFMGSAIKNVEVPEGVKSIGKFAFMSCQSVESVKISGSVTSMGEGAFCVCNSLKDVVIEKGLKEIPVGAFSSCFQLQNVVIPSSVKYIGQNAFIAINIESFLVEAATPPVIDLNAFGQTPNVNIIVPEGSKGLYEQDETWSKYGEISETKVASIGDVKREKAAAGRGVYTLSGQRVESMDKPGVYVVDGVKVVLRRNR